MTRQLTAAWFSVRSAATKQIRWEGRGYAPVVMAGLGSGIHVFPISIQLPGGANLLSAAYSGDSSYSSSSITYLLTVTPAEDQITVPFIPFSPEIVGTPVPLAPLC